MSLLDGHFNFSNIPILQKHYLVYVLDISKIKKMPSTFEIICTGKKWIGNGINF